MWRATDRATRLPCTYVSIFYKRNLQVPVAKGLKISFRRRRRRLVGGAEFEKMRVSS